MSNDVPLVPGEDAFPLHVFDALGLDPVVFKDRIGGSVMVIEKRPEDGPVTILTSGVSRLATDSGERIELAVEVVDGQQGAAMVALRIVINEIATNRRVPPVLAPWAQRDAVPQRDGDLRAAGDAVALGSVVRRDPERGRPGGRTRADTAVAHRR